MSAIENDWIEAFVAIADLRSFSAAGRSMHRSQSRISAYIDALENAIGATVVDRRHRPIELTDAGEAFLPFARRSLDEISLGVDSVASLTRAPRGRVVIGAHPSVSAGFLPDVLRDFSAANPQVTIDLAENTTVGLGEDLATGRLNLAIRSMSSEPPAGLVGDPLWRESYVAVVPQDHPLARLTLPLDPLVLVEYPLIIIAKPGSGLDPDTSGVLRRWSLGTGNVEWRTEQPQTLANLVKAGLGVGIINEFAMEVSDTTGLAVLPTGRLSEGRLMGLWHDPARYMSSAVSAMKEAILAAPIPAGASPVTSTG